MNGETIASFNRQTFRRPDLVRKYVDWDWIEEGEDRWFRQVEDDVGTGEVLELGVGGGRLVSRLSLLSHRYIGIDYSPEMIAACRERFPGVRFLCRDARDLASFKEDRFALAVFSFNGLDYVAHEERALVLRQICRVLRAGGWLVFSSHNMESELYLQAGGKPVREEFAVVHEHTGEFSYQCYYVKRQEVQRQLRATGFKGMFTCCDRDGREPGRDLRSGWLHYAVRK